MTDKEMAKNYALERQKNLHLSQRDTNLIHLAYFHGLKAKLKQLKQQVIHLEQEKGELLGIIQKKDELIQKLQCCANCKHGTQGEYDCFENCGSCHVIDCECEIKSSTENSSGKYHDWDDKCDRWELGR